jgi:replicative DNA helicase
MGKTDVMLHFAKMSGWAGFLPIVFSLEMPEKLITSRLIALTGGLTLQKCMFPKLRANFNILRANSPTLWANFTNL